MKGKEVKNMHTKAFTDLRYAQLSSVFGRQAPYNFFFFT